MILKQITLCNFRQFKGTQTAKFFSEAGESNVTVFYGENGRGKTGIFRAMLFCLYGDRTISQDGDVSDTKIDLVNKQAIQDAGPNSVVSSFVKLEFSHQGSMYQLKRGLDGMKIRNGEIVQEPSGVRLDITCLDGNARVLEDPVDVEEEIHKVLDKGIREYFLFDGEKIERLTRANTEQRREIARGVRKLLNVDALERAIKSLGKLKKKLDNELTSSSRSDLAKVIKELSTLEEEINNTSNNLETIETEIAHAESEKHGVDQALEQFKEIRHLIELRQTNTNLLKDREEQSSALLGEMKTYSSRAATLLLSKLINETLEYFNQQKKNGEIPPEIRNELIERILRDSRCICGRELREGTAAFECIQEWHKKTSDTGFKDIALQLWHELGVIHSNLGELGQNAESFLMRYGNVRNEIENLELRLQQISEKIGTSERKDASHLEKQRSILEKKLIDLSAKQINLENKLREQRDLRRQLEERKNGLEQEVSRHDEVSQRAILARKVHDAMQKIHEEFTAEIRDLIGQYATELFERLLDDQGKKVLSKILVNNDYSIEVYDRWGAHFLPNISSGQRQLMSISFIAALVRIAAKSQILEIPLFMDTPFGRLSNEHRENLIKEIPSFCSQWILLATDTEFRTQEAHALKKNKKWGHFAYLKAVEDGCTEIVDMSYENAMTLLSKKESDT